MLLSIITPIYNDGNYLPEMLESLKEIKDINYEIIIINDGSTDKETIDFLNSLDKNRYIIINQENLGISAARNNGIKISKGKYLLILDADNKILPDYIYKAIKILEENINIGVVYSDRYFMGLKSGLEKVGDFNIDKILIANYIDACAIYRKTVWEKCSGYDETLRGYEDWEFWINAYRNGINFFYIPEPLYYYRVKEKKESTNAWCQRPENFPYLIGKIYGKHYLLLVDLLRRKEENYTKIKNDLIYCQKQNLEFFDQNKSIVWKLLKKFDKFLDFVFGKNTKIRKVYNTYLSKLQNFNSYSYFFESKQNENDFALIFDKFKKFFAVVVFYPGYLLKNPSLFKNNYSLLFEKGLYASIQYAYDYIKLQKIKKNNIQNKQSADQNIEISYDAFVKKNKMTFNQEKSLKKEITKWKYLPTMSILTPVHKIKLELLKDTINSVKNQIYQNWELCLTNTSEQPEIKNYLEEEQQKDKRIKITTLDKNLGISGNTNEALKMATGEYVAFLDHDDILEPNTIWEVVNLLQTKPQTDLIYTDEDKVNENNDFYYEPFFKPDWSPDLHLSMHYVSHFTIIRKNIVLDLGGLKTEFDGAQDYDIVLRVSEKTNKIEHIPKVLYHFRAITGSIASSIDFKPYCYPKGRDALQAALNRRQLNGSVELQKNYTFKTFYKIKDSPLVSIIIPTKDKKELLQGCIESILNKTSYKNYEIIIIDNNSTEQKTKDYFIVLTKENNNIKVFEYPHKFNYSAINNFAVKQANGEYLLFLNNDTEIINNDWLDEMLIQAQKNICGVVGAKLLYPNKKIQHAGVLFFPKDIGLIHAFWNKPENYDYFGSLHSVRNYSAVTGACMMIPKNIFNKVGGFDENLPVDYNDVDLCLKIKNEGYLVIYTPYAELYHLESATRGFEYTPDGKNYLYKKWGDFIKKPDPYYNPNLSEDPAKTFEWRGY